MIIKVLGSGCKKCDKVYDLLASIQKEENLDFQIEKVEDLKSIVAYGVMTTPTLVINGDVLFKGKVPNKKKLIDEIKARV